MPMLFDSWGSRILRSCAALSVLSTLVATGCGDSGPRRYPVSGTVTLDGQSIAEGRIRFIDPNMKRDADTGKIIDGKFQFKSTAGMRRVEIRVARDTGKKGDTGAPLYEEVVAPEFNTESTLEVEVSATGKNSYELAVNSRSP